MLALALRSERRPNGWLWALMGAYSGLAALVNPSLLPSLLALLGWTAWQARRTLWYLPLALVVFCMVFAPWPIRNARALHSFIPLRSTVGFELWVGNRPGASGYLEESQFPIFNRWEYDQYAAKGEVAYMRDKAAEATTYMRAYPGIFLRLSGIRLVRFWMGTGNKNSSVFYAVHAVLTTSLGFMGIRRLVREGRLRLAALFALPLIVFPLPYYITHAEFRYRLVIDPLLTILAAYAICGAHEPGS
jgi:4-amino-4-deoxy-L-arabinose transferase-like glycosyltransferase